MSDYTPAEALAAELEQYGLRSSKGIAEELLDALAKVGHVVVTLPKAGRSPVEELDEGDDPRQWLGPTERYFIEEGSVASEGGFHWTPSGARQEAAALLAAAAAAEAGAR